MGFDYKRLLSTKINVGEKDKKIRLIAGSVSMGISLFTANIFLLVVGVVLVATGYTRVCPAYSATEKNTL
jgi:membrane protein implicated in regulation of membrane protease activity